MQTLESLKRRIENANDLHSIVKTMKALAAVSIRQYERAVEALAMYNHTTEMGLYVVLTNQVQEFTPAEPSLTGRFGAIVFGSDQGMVGQFNEQIAAYTISCLDDLGAQRDERDLLSVGIRVQARLEDAGQIVEEALPVPASATGILPMVQQVLLKIETWRNQRQVDQVYLFYNQPYSGAAYKPYQVRLLPMDLERMQELKAESWPSRSLPIYTMDRERLLSALVRQHLFVLLYRAFAESLASENASRLRSMQAAEKNIEDRLDELNAAYHYQRQTSITNELLDIVSGFEALAGGGANV